MLIDQRTLDAIVSGTVDRAFRRWKRPSVIAGTRLRTSHGIVEVTDVRVIGDDEITDDAARRAGYADATALLSDLRPPEPGRDLYAIELRWAGDDPRVALRADTDLSDEAVAAIAAAVARVGASGPPTGMDLLRLIEREPAVLAADLADQMGVEKMVLKRRVRMLKELGLTESLRVGYRLSPRGESFLRSQG